MIKDIQKIDLVPAIFYEIREDGKYRLKCLQGGEYVIRAFEPHYFNEIKDPKYIILGIATGVGVAQLNICDGSEYVEYYEKYWSVLLK